MTAALTIRGTRQTTATNAATNNALLPTGSVAGDFAVVIAIAQNTPGVPSGWVKIAASSSRPWLNYATFYRVLTTGDVATGSVAVAVSGGAASCVEVVTFSSYPADLVSLIHAEQVAGVGAGQGTGTITSPSFTATTADTMVFVGARRGGTAPSFSRSGTATLRESSADTGCSAALWTEQAAMSGAVSFTSSAGDAFIGIAIRVPGLKASETYRSDASSVVTLVGSGDTTETIVPGLDTFTLTVGRPAEVAVVLSEAMNAPGVVKGMTIRVRAGGLTGTVLASQAYGAAADRTTGDENTYFADLAFTPTTNRVCVTVQNTTNTAQITSARRFLVVTDDGGASGSSAVLTGGVGSFAGVLSGSVAAPAPSGTLAGSVGSFASAIAGTYAAPPISGSIAGAVGSFTASIDAPPAMSGLTASVAPFSGSFFGDVVVPFVGTADLSFESAGYDYTGESTATWEPAAATPPAGAFPAASGPRRVHHVVSSPTLDDGRPLFAGFGSEVIGPWCDYLRISVGGKDVTWFRDVQTVLSSWQNLDPYGDGPASLSFPQITEFETPGTGELAWLTKSAKVVINRVIDGVVVDRADPLYEGILTRDPVESGPMSITVEGTYMARMSRLLHQPYMMHNPSRTLAEHLNRIHRAVYSSIFTFVSTVDGPAIRSRGDRSMTRLGAVDHYLGLSAREDGGSYTLLPDRSVARHAMRLQLRSMDTVDVTVFAGAHGVKIRDLASDLPPNRIYGEGQAPDGGRWRNGVFPNAGYDDDQPDYPMAGGASFGAGSKDADTVNGDGISILTRRLWALGLMDRETAVATVFDDDVTDAVNEFRENLGLPQNGMVTTGLWGNLYGQGFNKQSIQGAHFEPLAAKTATVHYLRGAGGNIIGKNPNYDRKVMPSEEFIAFGENIHKRGGKKNARATINRAEVRVGTIVLTTDPAEMSRFEIRGGMTMLAKNLMGTGATGVKLYISSAEIDWQAGSVTCAVATSPLHFVELQTIRQRQVEARKNPSKRAIHMFRRSSIVSDTVTGWEAEGPSGVVPRRMIQAGQWNGFQVVAAERGTLAEMRFVADNPTAYQVMVFGQKVPEKLLNRKIGNPFHMRGGQGSRVVNDGVTTDGSTTVTSAAANFTSADVGRTITGDGIGTGGTVVTVNSPSSVEISHDATDTGTGAHLVIGASADYDQQNTFQSHADWLRGKLMCQAYGDPDQPGGYYPGRHTNEAGKRTTDPVTGVLFDDASQQFVTTGCFLWVYVWPRANTMFHGLLKLVPED